MSAPSSNEHLTDDCRQRVYENTGNVDLLNLLDPESRIVLDVGCGAGDNAALLSRSRPEAEIYGITLSHEEKNRAMEHMEACWVADVEEKIPAKAQDRTYDTLLFSHVLEHLREPAATLSKFVSLLEPGGIVLIAIPNVLVLSQRLKFLAGRFEYQTMGIMDSTHLRFFTYQTADTYLTDPISELTTDVKTVTGHLPLGSLRRHLFPAAVSNALDAAARRAFPNLFGNQILLRARKTQ